ncbi:MAG: ribbon-helix-helix protein, CopG family [Candidatus Bathyarchaeia archaeon]
MSKPVIYARMDENEVQLIKKVAKARGEDLSDFVRRAVKRELARLSYLSDEEKKALAD